MKNRLLLSAEPPVILLVSAIPADIAAVAAILEKHHYELQIAQDYDESIQCAISMQPDLILLDELAPLGDELKVCQELKKQQATSKIPIICISNSPDGRAAFLDAGAEDYLPKPLQANEVMARVQLQLRLSFMQQQLEAKDQQLQYYREESERQAGTAQDITELKQTELRLYQSEQQYRSLAENSLDLIARYDREARRIYINPAFEKMLQVRSSDFLGKKPTENSTLAAPDAYEQSVRQVFQDGKVRELEVDARLPDDSVLWGHVRFCPEYDGDGQIISVLAIGRDITALKQAQAMLRESEQRYREIFDNVSEVLYLLEVTPDQQFRYIEVNPAFVALTRIPRQEIIGKIFGSVLPDMAEPILAQLKRCLELGVTVDAELEVKAVDGTAGYRHITIVPVYEGGRICRIACISRDITARKQHEAVLQQHAELSRRLTHFAATAPGFMYTCELQGDEHIAFLYASPGVEDICGLKPENMISDSEAFCSRIRPDDLKHFYAEMQKSASSSTQLVCDFRIAHPTKGIIWAEARATPQRELDGSTLWYGFMTDITERKYTEEMLWASEQSLRTIVDHSPDVVIRYDREFRRVYVSRSYIDTHGLSAEEVLGKKPSDFWLSSNMTAHEFEQALQHVMETGQLSDIEFDWLKKPDEITYHWLRAVPEYDREGKVVSILAIARDVTAMKRAEAELAERERDLRTLIEHIPDNIIRYDRDMRICYINPAMAQTLRIDAEDFIGKSQYELIDSQALEEYCAVLKQVIETGKPADYLLAIRESKFIREIYDNIRFAPEFAADGSVIGAIAIGRDLSIQRKLEMEVALREREFRNLTDNIPDIIVRYDRDSRRVYCNKAYRDGHPLAAKAMGKTVQEFWWLEKPTAEEYLAQLRRIMETKVPVELTVYLIKNGEQGYRSMHLVPEIGQDGEVTGVLSISRDITRLMSTEALLRKREQEFRTLAQNSPDMIVRYDQQCRRIYINPAYAYYTGISIANALNRSPEEVWTSLMPNEEYTARLKRVMQTGQADQMLLEWVMPDGSIASHLMHAVPEYDEADEAVGVLVIGHNITDLKATERRLEESRAQLQRLTYHREEAREAERKRVAREIHDELGQLLSVLRLSISTLDFRYGDANPDLRNKTMRMGEVIDQAIDMIHTLATRLRPAVLESGIALALEWLVQEFSKSTGIPCDFEVSHPDMSLDKERALALFRIVQESMTNILRHAEADHVTISLVQHEKELVLKIKDNGKGFIPTQIGTGSFGIIGIQERVLMLGGKFDIDSAPGAGTLLRISIPSEPELERELL